MITHYQLTEMHAAWHDAANAVQHLMLASTDADRTTAFQDFHKSAARYRAAVEGATPAPSVIHTSKTREISTAARIEIAENLIEAGLIKDATLLIKGAL